MMSNKILVTYASKGGSTAGVAEAIGQTLAEGGADVDVSPMAEVQDLTPYQAIVAGSAIQGQQWLPEAMSFVETHQDALSQKPFVAFLVCMAMTISDGKYRDEIATWLQPVRNLVQPIHEGLFAGVLDGDKVPSFRDWLMFRASIALGMWEEGDHRDWNEIRRWAKELQPLLTT